jgi:hypothetical protein
LNTFLPKGHNATVIIVIEVILRQTFVPYIKNKSQTCLQQVKQQLSKASKARTENPLMQH